MEIGKIGMPAANVLDRIGATAFGSVAPRDGAGVANGKDFASLIQASLAQVDAMQVRAEAATHQYRIRQDGVSFEDAMTARRKADIAFETTVQVRDRIVAAYNEVMNMQL